MAIIKNQKKVQNFDAKVFFPFMENPVMHRVILTQDNTGTSIKFDPGSVEINRIINPVEHMQGLLKFILVYDFSKIKTLPHADHEKHFVKVSDPKLTRALLEIQKTLQMVKTRAQYQKTTQFYALAPYLEKFRTANIVGLLRTGNSPKKITIAKLFRLDNAVLSKMWKKL